MATGEKWTEGPHTVEYAEHLGSPAYAIRAADGDLISVGMLAPDAKLFAAAPDLFAALDGCLNLLCDGDRDVLARRPDTAKGLAALAKARGEA